MSLVNDMLRDLEDRQDHDSGKAAGVSPAIARQHTAMSRGSKVSLATGFALVLVAVCLWGWHSQWWQQPAAKPVDNPIAAKKIISTQSDIQNPPEHMDSRLRGNDESLVNQDTANTTPTAKQDTAQPATDITVAPAIDLAPEPEPQAVIAQQPTAEAEHSVAINTTAPAKEPVPQQPLPEAEQLATAITNSVTPSAETLDQKAADAARQLIQEGEVQRARNLLEDYLQQYPDADKSTLALAELHLDQGDHSALNEFLANTSALQPAQATLLQARSLLAQDRPDDAKSLLEQNPPSVEQHPDFHALLAGLYHKSGQHRSAATLYNRLLKVQQDSSIYWLGLAVALDALKDRNALQAFQRTRALNKNPDVQTYVEQRIAALSTNR